MGFDSRRREGARKRRRGADADADASADASADEEAEGGTGGSSPPRRRSAIEALRRRLGGPRGEGAAPPSLSGALRARHVGLVDSLPPPPPPRKGEGTEEDRDRKSDSDPDPDPRGSSSSSSSSSSYSPTGPARVDHAVLVLDPADPMSLPRLAEAAAALHPDYALGGRVTIVLAAPPGGGGVGPDPDLARALAQVERGGGGGNPTPTPTPVVPPPSSPPPPSPSCRPTWGTGRACWQWRGWCCRGAGWDRGPVPASTTGSTRSGQPRRSASWRRLAGPEEAEGRRRARARAQPQALLLCTRGRSPRGGGGSAPCSSRRWPS